MDHEFARYIREHSQNGREMADLMFRVLCGEPIRESVPGDVPRYCQPTVEDRRHAARWWTNRISGDARELLALLDGLAAAAPEATPPAKGSS